MTIPTITALAAIARTDADFVAKVDALFSTLLALMITEENASIGGINAAAATMTAQYDDLVAAGLAAVHTELASVTTVAGISGNVTTVAGISANVTTVAGAAAAVGTNATNIASINTNATNIAAILGADAAAAAAAASYDSFDDRYLGSKAVAPTLDNDGNALLTGALYWDTVLTSMRVYSGSAWSNTLVEVDDRVLQDQILLGGAEYATDIAGMAVKETERLTGELATTNATVTSDAATAAGATAAVSATVTTNADTQGTAIEQAVNALAHLLDLVGVVARAISGGTVVLGAGTATEPALNNIDDLNTGLIFPAADTMALVTAGLERWRVDVNGYLGLGTNAATGLLDVNDNRIRVRTAKTPASATAAGNAGEFCWDANYFYQCTATNTWRRAAHATW